MIEWKQEEEVEQLLEALELALVRRNLLPDDQGTPREAESWRLYKQARAEVSNALNEIILKRIDEQLAQAGIRENQ